MNTNRTIVALPFMALLFFLAIACKETPTDNKAGKNIPEKTATVPSSDSQIEWGEPSPPPEATGNPDVLFGERHKPQSAVAVDSVTDIMGEEYEWQTLDPVAIYRDIMRQVSYSSSSRSSRSSESSSQRTNPYGNDDYSLHYDLDQEAANSAQNQHGGVQGSGSLTTSGKTDFLQSFYARMLASGGTQIDEQLLTTSCRNYLREYAQEHNVPMARKFRTSTQKPTRSQGEMLRGMTIQPTGDDWFVVTLDEGFGQKRIDIKVVEVNGRLLIDMVK